MLHKRLHRFHHFQLLWRGPTLRWLLIILVCQGVLPCWRIEASKEARLPVVLLGSVTSGKNYTAAALLGTKFTCRYGYDNDGYPMFGILPNEKDEVEKKFGPLLRLESRWYTSRQEETMVYDHPDLPFPLYNMQGFGEGGLLRSFEKDLNTQGAHASLRKKLKLPIKGFVLHVNRYHVPKRVKNGQRSLDVMDFLLPYFEDAEAVRTYLAPSVCLVVTGFQGKVYRRSNVKKQKDDVLRSLRQLIQGCYADWYHAEKGSQAYARLAKQKAFYDVFVTNAADIQPDDEGGFAVEDFDLNLDKIVFFDPRDTVDLFYTKAADTADLEAAIATFKGMPAAALVQDEGGHAHWLWAVPVVGAAVYGWSWSQDSAKDENQEKKQSRTSRVSVRGDDDDDDDDTDDAIPELLTSQSPQTPFDDVT